LGIIISPLIRFSRYLASSYKVACNCQRHNCYWIEFYFLCL